MRNTTPIVIAFIAVMILLSSRLVAQIGITTIDTGYAEVNNTKVYYEISGKGEPFVSILGPQVWDPQFTALSKEYKVIRYDIRGFGRSALPDSGEVYKDCDENIRPSGLNFQN